MTSKTNQTTEEADTSASVAEPGAPVASSKARSKKGASPKKSVAKTGKTATKRPPTKAAANQPAKVAESKRTPKASKKTEPPIEVENARPPQAETKGGKILALIGREQGGKGRMVDHLPLLSDVGEALALYIREDRGVSASRRVFLRIWAPRNGLMGPAAVGHIVRRALAQAGVRRSGRGAGHLFRHGLATKMIRHGASMSEIAEVLRHRSQTTTAIYAQVSFEALRAVALPWPVQGGAR